MSLLYMVRHGQASFGMPNYDNLSPIGQKQAAILADHLIEKNREFQAVFTGNMLRHRQTAQPLVETGGSKGLCPGEYAVLDAFDEYDATTVWGIQIADMVKEDPGIGKDLENIMEDRRIFERLFRQAMLRWVDGNRAPREGPSWNAFAARVQKGVKEVMVNHGGQGDVVVFSSAGPISATMQFALGLDNVKAMGLAFATLNASITVFEFTKDHITLQGYNNVSYLEESLVTDR
ncbi:MAG: histidine phosphatase family protein [Desulfatibacillum sp.]|nr:histidine phosphatase family protein [Desulfatibacillum sp.]